MARSLIGRGCRGRIMGGGIGAEIGRARLLAGLGRAFAGALLFGLPMLMTMEMWWLGFHIDPLRLALLLGLTLPLLVRLSRFGGLRPTARVLDDVIDALVAVAVAALASALLLGLFGVVGARTSLGEFMGMVAIQTVPGSIGAILARNQLGGVPAGEEREQADATYGGALLLMMTGALFLSLNVAPTAEVMLIAYQMDAPQEIGLIVLSVGLMHGFVYAFGFRGSEGRRPGEGFLSLLLRYAVVGYVLVIAVNLYLLWTFGRTAGHAGNEVLSAAIVLGFPGAIGAAAARLIL